MIRNVVIHVSNEQPLLADLYGVPTASDAGLLCTNVRMMDGKRPVFIDAIDSTFFFPYRVIRFIEIPSERAPAPRSREEPGGPAHRRRGADSWAGHGQRPACRVLAHHAPDRIGDEPAAGDEPELDLEIDEDFLQRVRDI